MSRPVRGPLITVEAFCESVDLTPRQFWHVVMEGRIPMPQLIPPTFARLGLPAWDYGEWGDGELWSL